MKETPPSEKAQTLMRKILTEDEVRYRSRLLRKITDRMFGELPKPFHLDIEDDVRFHAVATRLREARESRGMDLKTAAKTLRVQQYRLRDIEACRTRQVRASVLHAYVDFLGMRRWFARWRKANPKLARALGVNVEP